MPYQLDMKTWQHEYPNIPFKTVVLPMASGLCEARDHWGKPIGAEHLVMLTGVTENPNFEFEVFYIWVVCSSCLTTMKLGNKPPLHEREITDTLIDQQVTWPPEMEYPEFSHGPEDKDVMMWEEHAAHE